MNLKIYENTPTIETKRLILRRFEDKDAQDLFEIMSDKEVNIYLPWFPFENLQDSIDYIEKYKEFYKKEWGYKYAIELKSEQRVIGYIHLSDKDGSDLGYGLNKTYWNKGYVTEGCLALINRIKDIGLDFITATHDRFNLPSGEVMKKIGMTYMYSYEERWMPKDFDVVFRMYQLNFKEGVSPYMYYWNNYENHFKEDL